MKSYLIYVAKRLAQFVLVVFVGISLTFFITHLTPIDPVEQMIASITAFSDTSPEAVALMREALKELYGIEGSLIDQYFRYWGRILALDFGPSLSAFPTPVSVLIGRALPWTIGLLFTCTMLAWLLGNLLGGLAGYYRKNRTLKVLGVIAMGFHPIPYYIIAFVLLIMFGYLWPVLPISGGAAQNVPQAFTLDYVGSVIRHSILPALSIILVSIGGWFMGMRALVSNIVTEDYVVYAELAGVRREPHPAVLRHAQCADAADHRPRHVARRNLQRRHHRRAGVQLSGPRPAADRRGLLGRLQPGARRHGHLDHRGIGGGVPDRYPLPDLRSAREARLTQCSGSSATSSATIASSHSAPS